MSKKFFVTKFGALYTSVRSTLALSTALDETMVIGLWTLWIYRQSKALFSVNFVSCLVRVN